MEISTPHSLSQISISVI